MSGSCKPMTGTSIKASRSSFLAAMVVDGELDSLVPGKPQ